AGLTNLVLVEESRQSLAHSRIENATLIERFVKLIPLPYPLAALVWSAVLTGPVFDAIAYLTTGATPVSLASLPNAASEFSSPLLPLSHDPLHAATGRR